MKSIYNITKCWRKIALLMVVAIQMSSCQDFLHTTPVDFATPTAYYNSQPALTSALVGIYSPLLQNDTYGYAIPIWQEDVTDEGYFTTNGNTVSASNDVAVNLQSYTSTVPTNFWRNCYVGIERANLLIANIGNAQGVDTSFVKAVLSEAKFLRGYYHFMLVQNFGDVPLKITPTRDATQTNVPRTPSKDVYAQIIKDMTEAEAGLPTYQNATYSNSTSRITKTAAEAILARVCLYMAGNPINDNTKYADAQFWANKVISSGLHSLYSMTDTVANVKNLRGQMLAYPASTASNPFYPAYKNNGYAQLFLNMATNVYSPRESMWEIDANSVSNTIYNMNTNVGCQTGISDANDAVTGGCVPYTWIHQYLYDLYASGDLRRDWAISPYGITGATGVRYFYTTKNSAAGKPDVLNRSVGKWRREYEPVPAGWSAKPKWNTQFNFPVIRYSDVLLMLCEAIVMTTSGSTGSCTDATALDAINQVRRRAFGLNPTTASATYDLTSVTLDEIQKERARELCFEGVRKADLIRWGIYLQRMQEVLTLDNNSYPVANRIFAVVSPQNTVTGGTKVLLWPIPSSEMLVNTAATQNPGY
ncbi:MAG: RagB/SusD family nutrient uptake outer membrane protein [Paludibacter sp.]